MTAMRRPSVPTVELKPATHAKLQAIAQEEDRPMGELVTFLVDRYEKERFWRGARADYERLRANPEAWKDYQNEVAAWEGLLGDGLENEPAYFTPEEEREIRERAAARAASR